MIASLMPQITQLDRLPLQRTAIIAYTQDATQPDRPDQGDSRNALRGLKLEACDSAREP